LIARKKKLTKSAKEGGFWVVAFESLRYLSQFILVIVLARVLSPSDFGIVALALVFIGLLDAFTELGIKTALIQRKTKSNEIYSVAWTLLILRGIVIFLICLFAAPWVASFFETPELTEILIILGLKPIFSGLANPSTINLLREFEYKSHFFYLSSGVIVRFLIVIPAALIFQNVWVLVLGNLSVTITRLVVSYFMFPYIPKFSLNWAIVKELFNFGKWIFGAQSMHILLRVIPTMSIAKILGTIDLGFYRIADQFGNILVSIFRRISSHIIMPIFSELNRREKEILISFRPLVSASLVVLMPAVVGGAILMRPLIIFLLGDNWDAVILPARMLIIASGIQAITQVYISSMIGYGFPKSEFLIRGLVSSVSLLLIFPMLYHFGIVGIAVSILIGQILGFSYSLILFKKKFNSLIADQLVIFKYCFTATTVMALIALIVQSFIELNIYSLVLLIFSCALIYVSVFLIIWLLFKDKFLKEIFNLILKNGN
jgi:O-antigen/teichoic acid export membrane protein